MKNTGRLMVFVCLLFGCRCGSLDPTALPPAPAYSVGPGGEMEYELWIGGCHGWMALLRTENDLFGHYNCATDADAVSGYTNGMISNGADVYLQLRDGSNAPFATMTGTYAEAGIYGLLDSSADALTAIRR